jgi:hypothetical protein
MFIFKNFLILSMLLILTNCGAPGTALLGPAFTGARTGSVYQSGLSYGSSHVIKKTKESLKKIKEAKTVVYQQVDDLNKKIKKNKLDKVVLKNQAELFFKAAKANFKKYD